MTSQAENRDAHSITILATIEGAFAKLYSEPGADAPSWLRTVRKKAFETFHGTGFPKRKDEDWKYTNLAPYAERSAAYLQNRPTSDNDSVTDALLNDLPQNEGETRVVFINGLHRPDLSIAGEPNPGIELTPYSTADSSSGERILRHQPVDHNSMIALNTAFLTDGLAIHVRNDNKIDTPIHVVFVSNGQTTAVQPRLSIDVGRNASALVIQHHIGAGESLTNAVTCIDCAEYSRLFFVRLQNESLKSMHVSNQIVRVAADGHFDGISIDLGGELARSDLNVDLYGKRAHANLYGLFMADGKRHVDDHLRVDHRAPDTTSQENYRGILNETAHGVFNGKVIVHSGADGTNALMSNRNLLLSERAEINTKPELEIYTDDVMCAHGATTGQLDMNSLFYLRARGIPEAAAKLMLIDAFAQEIIEHLRSRAPHMANYLGKKFGENLPDGT